MSIGTARNGAERGGTARATAAPGRRRARLVSWGRLEIPPPAALAGPRRLTFVTSPDDCNLACRMCREHSPLAAPRAGPPRRLPAALVARVLAERAGSPLREVVPSTMGEPLLWAGLDDLVDRCAAAGLRVNVTTNGTFPGRGARAWAERLVPVASDVKISWNAAGPATAARLMGGLSLAAAEEGVRAFAAVRDARRARGLPACRLTFQVTAQEGNVAELPALVALAARLGVERVKLNQLQVHFPALSGEDLRRDRASRRRWNAAVEGMRGAATAHPLPWGAAVALENAVPWREEGEPVAAGPCPFLGREAWVTAEGAFAPCPAPAGQDGRLGRFGALTETTIGEIWAGPAYGALTRGYADRTECRGCPFRRPGGA